MIVVDSSVWIDHFRRRNPRLEELLEAEDVVMHPFVLGELACGPVRNRERVISDLKSLASLAQAANDDVLHLIESRKLWGKGIGWVDAHVLTATILAQARLWTLDRPLYAAARELRVEFTE